MIQGRIVYRCLVSIICLVLTTGCWDRAEMDDLALVIAGGLDVSKDGQLEGTLQIALPTEIPSSLQSGGQGQKPVLVVSAKGKSAMDILDQLQQQLSRRIFFGYRAMIIIGEEYARQGINQALDQFARSPISRYNSYVLTAYGSTAKEILNTPYMLEKLPAIGMKKVQLGDFGLSIKIDEFLNALTTKGKSPVTGAIRIINQETDRQTFLIDKAAVYRDNKLVGFLSQQEMNVLRWWKGGMRKTKISTQVEPEVNGFKGTVSVELLRVKTKIHTTIKHGIPKASVTFKGTARTLENDTKLNLSDPKNLQSVEMKISHELQNTMMNAFTHVQKDFKADVFGLGESIHIEHPEVWKKIKDQWKSIYPEVPIDVKVNFKIERTGRTQAPIHLQE